MSWKCEICDTYNDDSQRECYVCGHARPIKHKSIDRSKEEKPVIDEKKEDSRTYAESTETTKDKRRKKDPKKTKICSSKRLRNIIIIFIMAIIGIYGVGIYLHFFYRKNKQQNPNENVPDFFCVLPFNDSIERMISDRMPRKEIEGISDPDDIDFDNMEYDDEDYDDYADTLNDSADSDQDYSFYGVWCFASRDYYSADLVASELCEKGYPAFVCLSTEWSNLNSEPWYVVTAGDYYSEDEAKAVLEHIQQTIPDAYIWWSGYYIGELHTADSNGRFCGAKRTRCGASGLTYSN